MTVHNFKQSLEAANADDVEEFLDRNYREFFPHMVGSLKNDRNNLGQHLGIDRLILLNNGSTIRCEEKVRANNYGDFLFEYQHRYADGKVVEGWAQKDLLTDFFIYCVPKDCVFWAMPWALLKGVWLRNGEAWRRRAPKIADNGKFKTVSYAVGLDELKRALVEQMFFRNSAND